MTHRQFKRLTRRHDRAIVLLDKANARIRELERDAKAMRIVLVIWFIAMAIIGTGLVMIKQG